MNHNSFKESIFISNFSFIFRLAKSKNASFLRLNFVSYYDVIRLRSFIPQCFFHAVKHLCARHFNEKFMLCALMTYPYHFKRHFTNVKKTSSKGH